MDLLKFSTMTAASALTGTESIPVIQSADNFKTTPEDIKVYQADEGSYAPRFVKPNDVLYTEHSNASGDWTVYHGTKSDDTTNYIHSPTFKNIRLTGANADSGLYATKTLTSPWIMAGKHIAFYYYIPATSSIHYVYIHFDESATSDAWTDYFEQKVYDYSSTVGGYSGWHLFTAVAGSYNWTVVGTPDWSNIKYIRIYTETDSTINSEVVVGSIFVFEPPNVRGLVVIGMDGAYSGQKKAVAYANSKGIPITLYIAESFVGSGGRLTLAQLQDIKRFSNNLIANYLYALEENWQDLTLAEKILAVKMGASYLRANGFGDGAKICSPPGVGQRSEAIQEQIMTSLIDMPCGFNSSESAINNLWDVKSLYANITPGSIGDVALATLLSTVISDRAVAVELWHSPYDNIDGTQANWETHIDAIKTAIDNGTIEAVTPLDIWLGKFDRRMTLKAKYTELAVMDLTNNGVDYIGRNYQINVADNATMTFEIAGCGMFKIWNQQTLKGALFFAEYTSVTITKISDVSSGYEITDTDTTKIAVFKSANDNTISVKNYTNVTAQLGVEIFGYSGGATAPA